MRTLGLLGGMSYHATIEYYSQINSFIQERRGGSHSAKIVMHSFDFAEIVGHFMTGNVEQVSKDLCTASRNLESIGADAIVLCMNTAHLWAEDIEKATIIPLLHIIDYTGDAILKAGLKKIAFLGTKASMEKPFLTARLTEKYGLDVMTPADQDTRDWMDKVIAEKLTMKVVTPETKRRFLEIIGELVRQGTEGVILGCTELQFVVKAEDIELPMFDTVALHARGVAEWALESEI